MAQSETHDPATVRSAHASTVESNVDYGRDPGLGGGVVGIDDEEKARAIAEHDLKGSRKQACHSGPNMQNSPLI